MVFKIVGITIVLVVIATILIAKSKGVSPLSWKIHNSISQYNDVAIAGFDPVSYFDEQKAVKGSEKHSYTWQNVHWYFTSLENLKEFKKNPASYAPQFGGYCSFAVSKGFTATPDPNAWYIQDDKLYLFADERMKKRWVEQLPDVQKVCEKKWTY